MINYVRISNVSSSHAIADVGSTLENDHGNVVDHISIGLDRLLYTYNCYHYSLKSLGNKPFKFVKDSLARRDKTKFPAVGFGAYNSLIRTQPTVTNLLSSESTVQSVNPTLNFLVLNWDF